MILSEDTFHRKWYPFHIPRVAGALHPYSVTVDCITHNTLIIHLLQCAFVRNTLKGSQNSKMVVLAEPSRIVHCKQYLPWGCKSDLSGAHDLVLLSVEIKSSKSRSRVITVDIPFVDDPFAMCVYAALYPQCEKCQARYLEAILYLAPFFANCAIWNIR